MDFYIEKFGFVIIRKRNKEEKDVDKVKVGQVQVKQGQMRHFKRPFLGTQFEGNVV